MSKFRRYSTAAEVIQQIMATMLPRPSWAEAQRKRSLKTPRPGDVSYDRCILTPGDLIRVNRVNLVTPAEDEGAREITRRVFVDFRQSEFVILGLWINV
jgi:hypothetical protein